MKRIWLVLVFLLSVNGISAGETIPNPKNLKQINKLLETYEKRKTDFSIHFRDLADGKTVFSRNCDTALIPASNMKLITTAAALDMLGEDFSYETIFALYESNLAIFAGGDPLTGDPVIAQQAGVDIYYIFDKVLEQLKSRNITHFAGGLIIDNSIFDDERYHPSWPIEQANTWYAAQVDALNFNDNCLDVTFAPSTPLNAAKYQISPDTGYVNITNRCQTIPGGKTAVGASRDHGTNNITLRGTCSIELNEPINVAIERPSAFCGFVLAEQLLRNDIRFDGQLVIQRLYDDSGRLPKNMDILLVYRTPLADVLQACNQRSLNLAAECLFKTLGAYYQSSTGRPRQQGSWPTGRQAVQAFLEKLNIDPAGFKIDDGSGLSRENRLSARCITTVLAYMYPEEIYRRSLATPDTGTLQRSNRFDDPAYKDRIMAKTGYIAGARSLSGYCRNNAGRWLAFSILANDGASSDVLDEIAQLMMD